MAIVGELTVSTPFLTVATDGFANPNLLMGKY
jgi:hypothetical protein